jgi:hypothetical protein
MRTRLPTVVTGFPACAKAITPSDVTPLLDFNNQPRAQTVYVGTAGSVSVIPVGNDLSQPVSFVCPAGGLVPVEVKYVRSSGTTAGGLVGLF